MLLLLAELDSDRFYSLFREILCEINPDQEILQDQQTFDPFGSWIQPAPIQQPLISDLWSSDEESEKDLEIYFSPHLTDFLDNIGKGFTDDNNGNEISNIWETCARYKPIHFYMQDWGIDIKEGCVFKLMKSIARFLPIVHKSRAKGNKYFTLKLMSKCFKAGFYLIYFHEYFHHMTESCSIRLATLTKKLHYPGYFKNVYEKTFGKDKNIEEALANAFSYYSLSDIHHWKHLGEDIIEATRKCMIRQFERARPGYRRAVDLIGRKDLYLKRLNTLFSQIYSKSIGGDPMIENIWSKIGLNEDMFSGLVIPELIPIRWYRS